VIKGRSPGQCRAPWQSSRTLGALCGLLGGDEGRRGIAAVRVAVPATAHSASGFRPRRRAANSDFAFRLRRKVPRRGDTPPQGRGNVVLDSAYPAWCTSCRPARLGNHRKATCRPQRYAKDGPHWVSRRKFKSEMTARGSGVLGTFSTVAERSTRVLAPRHQPAKCNPAP
jgi:hypothetical protein